MEDLLDGVRLGANGHAGIEVPVHQRVRLYGLTRFEIMSDLHYFELRGGLQVFLGSDVPSDHPRPAPNVGS